MATRPTTQRYILEDSRNIDDFDVHVLLLVESSGGQRTDKTFISRRPVYELRSIVFDQSRACEQLQPKTSF